LGLWSSLDYDWPLGSEMIKWVQPGFKMNEIKIPIITSDGIFVTNKNSMKFLAAPFQIILSNPKIMVAIGIKLLSH